jgi:hypothetical protein
MKKNIVYIGHGSDSIPHTRDNTGGDWCLNGRNLPLATIRDWLDRLNQNRKLIDMTITFHLYQCQGHA